MVTGHNGWLLAYDNISVITDAVSDGLCMVSTGGAYAGRALFSNDERSVIHVQRPVILSGIEEFVARGDLSDRSVYLNLPPIDEPTAAARMSFGRRFTRISPRSWEACSTRSSGACANCPSINLPKLPRMADFAAFGEAVGRTLRWPAGTFLADYDDNRRESTVTQLEDSTRGNLLLRIAHRHRRLDRHRVRAAATADSRCGQGHGILIPLAEIPRLAYQRTPPHCPSAPHARLVRHV